MAIEIERKFLVVTRDMLDGLTGTEISQGYLSHLPDSTVRVRIAGEQGWLTIKGRTHGASRAEFEYPVPLADARALLELCQCGRIEKTRYRLPQPPHTWEIDVFHGDNDGLVVAEIELASEQDNFHHPDWLGEEVTSDPRYFNSALSSHPYRHWPQSEGLS